MVIGKSIHLGNVTTLHVSHGCLPITMSDIHQYFWVQLFQTFTNYLITHWAWPRLWWWGINLREIHLFQQSLQVWWSFLHYICNACRLLQAWLYKVCNVYKEHVIFVIWKTSVWLTGQCSTHYVCISLHSINATDRTRQIHFAWRYCITPLTTSSFLIKHNVAMHLVCTVQSRTRCGHITNNPAARHYRLGEFYTA